jgi:hypothetical protein
MKNAVRPPVARATFSKPSLPFWLAGEYLLSVLLLIGFISLLFDAEIREPDWGDMTQVARAAAKGIGKTSCPLQFGLEAEPVVDFLGATDEDQLLAGQFAETKRQLRVGKLSVESTPRAQEFSNESHCIGPMTSYGSLQVGHVMVLAEESSDGQERVAHRHEGRICLWG